MIQDYFEEALERIKDAKNGIVAPSIFFKNQNTDRPFSLNSKMRFGMGVYMVMTGPPGTGKTSFIDSEFVINPILDHIKDPTFSKIYCIYRSMERPPVEKMVKFIAYMLYIATSGEILVDTSTLLGYPSKKRELTSYDIELISELKGHIKEISKSLDLVAGADTPQGIKDYLTKSLYRLGKYVTTDNEGIYVNGVKLERKFDLTDEEGRPYALLRGATGKEIKVGIGFNRYFAKDKDMIIYTVNDTTNKIRVPSHSNYMDASIAHSFNMAEFREHGALGVIDINQFSKVSDKEFKGSTTMSVSLSDIKGVGDFGQNADICLSILDPMYFGVKTWGGSPDGLWPEMELDRFHGTFRLLQIFKNSGGMSLYKMPCVFLGENGYFYEIPAPNKITENDYKEINDKILSHLNPMKEARQSVAFDLPKDMLIKKPNRDTKAPF